MVVAGMVEHVQSDDGGVDRRLRAEHGHLYYSAQVFLMGAVFTWVYAQRFGSRRHQAEPTPDDSPVAPPIPERSQKGVPNPSLRGECVDSFMKSLRLAVVQPPRAAAANSIIDAAAHRGWTNRTGQATAAMASGRHQADTPIAASIALAHCARFMAQRLALTAIPGAEYKAFGKKLT